MPSYEQLKGSFDFSSENFTNVNSSSKGTFTADVISPSDFFGSDINATNVKVIVEYGDSGLKSIKINYNTSDSNVLIFYKFQK